MPDEERKKIDDLVTILRYVVALEITVFDHVVGESLQSPCAAGTSRKALLPLQATIHPSVG